jgi:hypothetical protein
MQHETFVGIQETTTHTALRVWLYGSTITAIISTIQGLKESVLSARKVGECV